MSLESTLSSKYPNKTHPLDIIGLLLLGVIKRNIHKLIVLTGTKINNLTVSLPQYQ